MSAAGCFGLMQNTAAHMAVECFAMSANKLKAGVSMEETVEGLSAFVPGIWPAPIERL